MTNPALFGLLLLATSALAHEGHDHESALPVVVQTLAPRLVAQSPEFELVAALEQGHLQIFLDDFRTNQPIANASVEVECGAFHGQAVHRADGVYELDAEPLAGPGRHDMVFTIQTPVAEDLLLGTLEVTPPAARSGDGSLGGVVAWYDSPRVLQPALLVLLLWLLWLLFQRDRREGLPVIVLVAVLAAMICPAPAFAHGGEDHGSELGGTAPAMPAVLPGYTTGSATRLPDGSLLVPKPVQRLLGLRTVPAEAGEWPDSFTLNGHVIADPNASALVQAPLRGRIEIPEGGLSLLGARIARGEVLAYLAPILDTVDQTTLQADVAQTDGRIQILGRNLERLLKLGANAPRQDLEQTEAEHTSLLARRKAITDSFTERLPLTAPVAGVLALRNASPGQIVAAGETIFTLVDPQRLWVEALLYDTEHATHFVSASARAADGQTLRLSPLGSGYELRGHALPLQFRIEAPPDGTAWPHLVVSQPLVVIARMNHGHRGLRIPTAAVQKDADGTDLVWIHEAPERFRARPVRIHELGDGDSVATQGLTAGDRVVTDGASLLAQIR